MATSERILTTIPSAAGLQRVSPQSSWSQSRSPIWWQVLADFATICLVLILVPALFGDRIEGLVQFHRTLPPFAVALMITTILGFSGTYRRSPTPLDIGGTEGLVRGICCTAILLVIFSIGSGATLNASMLLPASLLVSLLVLWREIAHVFARYKSLPWWPRQQDLPVRSQREDAISVGTGEAVVNFELPYCESLSSYVAKRTVDLTGALILLLLALPFLLAVVVLIKLDSKGPAFLRQRRIGRFGVPFYMWKFRSMHQGVARYERSPVSETDPRLTKIGRALRRFSIDEIPQLLNIIKGEMSLVGPRPEMPFIVEQYDPYMRLRLHAMPGITGLWQISPARAMPIHEHVEFDLFYIENRNIFLDLAIMLRTITAVVRGIGAT